MISCNQLNRQHALSLMFSLMPWDEDNGDQTTACKVMTDDFMEEFFRRPCCRHLLRMKHCLVQKFMVSNMDLPILF